MAQGALSLHIRGMVEDGEQLPEPSKLEEIMVDPDFADAVAYLIVTIPDNKPRTVRVNITLPENTLRQKKLHAERCFKAGNEIDNPLEAVPGGGMILKKTFRKSAVWLDSGFRRNDDLFI